MQGRRAGLPEAAAVQGWTGKILVDRDGMEIGICRTIFTDDDTGLPEWATADVRGRPVLVPLVDAVESGPRVRVVVRGVDVADAPEAEDDRHVSVEAEERLYQHYGIEYSRADSGSGLPVGPAEAQRARHLAVTREARVRRTLVLALEAAVVLAAVVGAVVAQRHGTAAGAGPAPVSQDHPDDRRDEAGAQDRRPAATGLLGPAVALAAGRLLGIRAERRRWQRAGRALAGPGRHRGPVVLR